MTLPGEDRPDAVCRAYALKHGHDAADALWFADPGSPEASEAKRKCMQECPLYWQCQEYALAKGITHGVWGGLDEDDRYRLWRSGRGMPTTFLDEIQRAFNGLTRDQPTSS